MPDTSARRGTLAYVAPFAVFIALMAVQQTLALPAQWLYPVRFFASAAALAWFSRGLDLRPSSFLASAAVGAAVFLIWIGPDAVFGSGYRQSWLFHNLLAGGAASAAPDALKHNLAFVLVRTAGCVALVPVIEELFWRGWLMRWLIRNDFEKIPLGAYAPLAFWGVALLFASEHGSYWEVGLAAGIIYNWWLVRTGNLGNCIVAHAVTNGLLSGYVLLTGQWQYWG